VATHTVDESRPSPRSPLRDGPPESTQLEQQLRQIGHAVHGTLVVVGLLVAASGSLAAGLGLALLGIGFALATHLFVRFG
jgi:hypothetical protein